MKRMSGLGDFSCSGFVFESVMSAVAGKIGTAAMLQEAAGTPKAHDLPENHARIWRYLACPVVATVACGQPSFHVKLEICSAGLPVSAS
jgi:hypothetical protein